MAALVPCPHCGRHHREAESTCPHCKVAVASSNALWRNLKVGALLAFTAATAAACYGTPPPEPAVTSHPKASAKPSPTPTPKAKADTPSTPAS